jgi:BirA family biotin operon repressor/biotin-[acetyl-CoA-carboxylase] ligase
MSESVPHAYLVPAPPRTVIVGSRILTFTEVGSTNDIALRTSGDGVVVVADVQKTGRGRFGRAWHSGPGLGVWCSVGLNGHLEGLMFAAALAVRDAVRPRCEPTLKWPNDVQLHGRKFCGILVEYRQNRTAVGIGINVGHTAEDFPSDLRDTATSLCRETGEQWDRTEVLEHLLSHLDRRVMALRHGGYADVLAEWRAACNIVGRRISCGPVTGVVRAVQSSGALEVQTDGGMAVVTSADAVIQHGE